jgi:hypothetical protein
MLGLTKYQHSLYSSTPGVDRTPVIIFQQSQLCLSLIAATLACLESFIRSFDTGSVLNVNYSTETSGSNGYGNSQSYRMQSLGKNGSLSSSQDRDKADLKISRQQFKTDVHGNHRSCTGAASNVMATSYTSGRPKEMDGTSHGSQELFIRRDVQWEVRSENLSPTRGNKNVAELGEGS